MKLKNTSTRDYMHNCIILKAGETMEITDEKMIKVLLNQEGIEEVIDKSDVEKMQKEIEQLKATVKKPAKKKK